MKPVTRLLLLVLVCQLTSQLARPLSAQAASARYSEFSVSGQILNPDGAPLPGAVVMVKGTTHLTTSNAAGAFLLPVPEASPVLVVSCQGYQTQMLAVEVSGGLNIKLYPVGVAVPANVSVPGAKVLAADRPPLVVADVQPMFKGGATAYRQYLHDNAHYPEVARQAGVEGAVYVSFWVDERGHILDAEVTKGAGNGFDEEALRLVRLMPYWNPGQLNGQAVKVPCTLRIKFGLDQGQ